MTLTVDAPAPDRLDGAALLDELRAAGVTVGPAELVYDPAGPVLHIDTDATAATVKKVVAAHVPPEPAAPGAGPRRPPRRVGGRGARDAGARRRAATSLTGGAATVRDAITGKP